MIGVAAFYNSVRSELDLYAYCSSIVGLVHLHRLNQKVVLNSKSIRLEPLYEKDDILPGL